jgi:S-formylglutathione hydrolase FrmB
VPRRITVGPWSPLTPPSGAGFYINATNPKWAKYRMYDLVTKELPEVLKEANLGLVRDAACRGT